MSARTKQELEDGFTNCCGQLSKERSKNNPDEQKINKLKKARVLIAKGINITRDRKKGKTSFADIGWR